jgi:hypothetical protein
MVPNLKIFKISNIPKHPSISSWLCRWWHRWLLLLDCGDCRNCNGFGHICRLWCGRIYQNYRLKNGQIKPEMYIFLLNSHLNLHIFHIILFHFGKMTFWHRVLSINVKHWIELMALNIILSAMTLTCEFEANFYHSVQNVLFFQNCK